MSASLLLQVFFTTWGYFLWVWLSFHVLHIYLRKHWEWRADDLNSEAANLALGISCVAFGSGVVNAYWGLSRWFQLAGWKDAPVLFGQYQGLIYVFVIIGLTGYAQHIVVHWNAVGIPLYQFRRYLFIGVLMSAFLAGTGLIVRFNFPFLFYLRN